MKKFPVDLSENGIRALLNSPDSYTRRFTETSLRALLGYPKINGTLSNQKNEFPPVPWDMEKLRTKVQSEVSKRGFKARLWLVRRNRICRWRQHPKKCRSFFKIPNHPPLSPIG
jgi:hypothetical protein